LPKSRLAVGSSDNGGRILRERAGDKRELPLAAADARVLDLGQPGDAERGQRFERLGTILLGRRRKQGQMRSAPHHHHVDDPEGKVGGVRLRHIGDASRDLASRQLVHRPAVEQHFAGLGGQQAKEGLE
jgi:hypothetical protein